MKLGDLSARWQGEKTISAEKHVPLARQLNAMLAKSQVKTEKPAPLANRLHAMLAKPQAQGKKAAGINKNRAEIEQRRRQYERELRACRTKKEVEAVRMRWRHMFMSEMSAINRSDMPIAIKQQALEEARLRHEEREEVYLEFRNTARFYALPDDDDKKKQNHTGNQESILETQKYDMDTEEIQDMITASLRDRMLKREADTEIAGNLAPREERPQSGDKPGVRVAEHMIDAYA